MGLNEVFKKVSAINEVTELASEKIELASVAELEKFLKESNSYKPVLDKYISDAKKIEQMKEALYNGVYKVSADLTKLNDSGTRAYLDFGKKAKELGLDPNSAKPYKDAEIVYESNRKLLGELLKLRNAYGKGSFFDR